MKHLLSISKRVLTCLVLVSVLLSCASFGYGTLWTVGGAGVGALFGAGYGAMVDAGQSSGGFWNGGWTWSQDDGLSEKGAQEGAIWGAAIGGGLALIGWLLYQWLSPSYAPRPARVSYPVYSEPAPPQVQPKQYPTLTTEELQKVELAYEATVRGIEGRGKRIYIGNTQERVAFIRRYQGNPDTASTAPLWREVFGSSTSTQNYYDSSQTSETAIVRMAKNEPNAFRKVRMIHDWVSDILAYDWDYYNRMIYMTGRNEEFTLGQIIARESGVCLEYAIAFYYLMDAAGINTYLISDHSKPGIGHAYNMVIINGTGYIIDTTWDSKNHYQNGRFITYNPVSDTKFFMRGVSESYQLRGW
jgi:hypothetical protein